MFYTSLGKDSVFQFCFFPSSRVSDPRSALLQQVEGGSGSVPDDSLAPLVFSFLFLLHCLNTSSLHGALHSSGAGLHRRLPGGRRASRHRAQIRHTLRGQGARGSGCLTRRDNSSFLHHVHAGTSLLFCILGPSKVLELYCNQLLLPCCKDH